MVQENPVDLEKMRLEVEEANQANVD